MFLAGNIKNPNPNHKWLIRPDPEPQKIDPTRAKIFDLDPSPVQSLTMTGMFQPWIEKKSHRHPSQSKRNLQRLYLESKIN